MDETKDTKEIEASGANSPPPPYPNATPYPTQAYPTQPYPAQPYPTQPYPAVVYQPQQEAVPFLQGQSQGQVVQQQPAAGPPPDDCLIYAIFTLLCCFWPLGLVAVIRSVQCRSAIRHGNMLEAGRLSKRVRCLANASLIIGIVFEVLIIIVQICTRLIFVDDYDHHANSTVWNNALHCLNCTTAKY